MIQCYMRYAGFHINAKTGEIFIRHYECPATILAAPSAVRDLSKKDR